MFHKVFVDIPRITSLEEYSPLVMGDVPTSLATKMADMENEIRALKRAREALRQYVMSVLPPQHPVADSLTRPPTESLPNIGADTFPHPTADAPSQSGSCPLNGPAAPAAFQALHGAVGQAGASVEATPADVDMDASASLEATPADVDMAAGEDDVGVSESQASSGGQLGRLENGEIPQDQRRHFACMPPQVTDPVH